MRVTVRAYEDLQCSDCARFQRMLDEELLPEYGGRVRFEYRAFPLPKHPAARPAAIAARYFEAIDAELALAFRRYCFARIGELTPENLADAVREFAGSHHQDGARAVSSMEDAGLAAEVDGEYREGLALGVTHTPTVFVNGKSFIETFTAEEISQSIDAALNTHTAANPESK